MLGAIELTGLTQGLIPAIENAVTIVIPVVAVIIGAVMSVRLIMRFLQIRDYDRYYGWEDYEDKLQRWEETGKEPWEE